MIGDDDEAKTHAWCVCVRWSTHWFRLDLEIPDSWIGKEVKLLWDSMTEALVWKNGQPVQVDCRPVQVDCRLLFLCPTSF